MNIAGNYFDFDDFLNQKDADYKAILSDWEAVGNDVLLAEIYKAYYDTFLNKHTGIAIDINM